MESRIVHHQLSGEQKQQIEMPNNSKILGVALIRRVPTLIVLEGRGTGTSVVTVGMYEELQLVQEGACNYIGTLDINGDGRLIFHFIEH